MVVSIPANPVRRSGDGTGILEATSVSSAAWLAGSGLLAFTWPAQMDHVLRGDWLDQQTETAWELADDLDGPDWSTLSLPVDGVPTPFHYRESEFGWVLAGFGGQRGAPGRVRARSQRVRARLLRDRGHRLVRLTAGARAPATRALSIA